MAAAAVLIATLLCAAMIYDTMHLFTPRQTHWPPLARLRGRRAALEAEERWCTGLLLHGRIDGGSYQQRMSGLARAHRVDRLRRHGRSSRHCY